MLMFGRPWVFVFILLIIPGVYLNHFWKGRGSRIAFPVNRYPRGLALFQPGMKKGLAVFTALLFWISLTAFIFAAAEPKQVFFEEVFLNRGADIMFVVDESPSMAAQDFQPGNRFEAAKRVLKMFIDHRENDYIGLVTFGKEAVLQLAPTKDYDTLVRRLESIQPGDLGDETAIGLGVGVACTHLQYSPAKEKIIILLTDGENNTGEVTPLQAADIASTLGIRVHTCGIGHPGETFVEYADPKTGKIVQGTYHSDYNEELLQNIAGTTGGLFFQAPSEDALSEIFQIIDQVETQFVDSGFHRTQRDRFYFFLLPGLALFIFQAILRYGLLKELFL